MYRKWNTGLLCVNVVKGGGGGGGGLNVCVSRHTIPLDVATYSKLLIRRQGLILRQGHLKVYHRQACWKQLKSGQASREHGERVGGRGATSPLPSPRSQFTYFLQSERHYLDQDDRKSATNT